MWISFSTLPAATLAAFGFYSRAVAAAAISAELGDLENGEEERSSSRTSLPSLDSKRYWQHARQLMRKSSSHPL
ncbi:hypothetical protein GGU10DRAFT_356180 [Lentinula aff. detonsa]|uniref:Secreted protein n=1 Tax=Lentinula aff. detonsa TaxID=2804958 RepID=A0AA38NLV5_9AGAR|nr:hypothetical protein GGU10DRAFT_356180 [Lentinula aff. detonsa]